MQTSNMNKHWQQQAQALSREARGGKTQDTRDKETHSDQIVPL